MRDKETTLSFQSLRATEVVLNNMNKTFETKAVSRRWAVGGHPDPDTRGGSVSKKFFSAPRGLGAGPSPGSATVL